MYICIQLVLTFAFCYVENQCAKRNGNEIESNINCLVLQQSNLTRKHLHIAKVMVNIKYKQIKSKTER